MIKAQRHISATFGIGGEDPYFWASKLHFYITGLTFYNFPYTFGYLLSRGLYALFKKQGASFLTKYEEFLRLAGSDTAENVVKRAVGEDIEKVISGLRRSKPRRTVESRAGARTEILPGS